MGCKDLMILDESSLNMCEFEFMLRTAELKLFGHFKIHSTKMSSSSNTAANNSNQVLKLLLKLSSCNEYSNTFLMQPRIFSSMSGCDWVLLLIAAFLKWSNRIPRTNVKS